MFKINSYIGTSTRVKLTKIKLSTVTTFQDKIYIQS